MAGFYTDVPGGRMAYDADGTVGFSLNGNKTGTPSTISNGNLIILNNENIDGWVHPNSSGTYSWGFIFPELRDIIGIYHSGQTTSLPGPSLDWSADTTERSSIMIPI
jgi:hypothetical protein